jgi:hypothetical protein
MGGVIWVWNVRMGAREIGLCCCKSLLQIHESYIKAVVYLSCEVRALLADFFKISDLQRPNPYRALKYRAS